MAKQFVFVRIVRMNDVDFNFFKHDFDLTWMGYFMNADGRIYARYGGRTSAAADARLTKAGLLHTMNEVLRVHQEGAAAPPGIKPAAPQTAKELPMFAGLMKVNPKACIHCHMVNEGLNFQLRASSLKKEDRKESYFAYPPPENLGITPDLTKGNIVKAVRVGSLAEKAGMQKGDIIRLINGNPVLTTFDIQFGLNETAADNKIAGEFERDGKRVAFTVKAADDWKKWDTSWRKSLHNAQPNLGWTGVDLDAKERAKAKIAPDAIAFNVRFVRPGSAIEKAGIKQGDLIVAIAGKRQIPYLHLQGYIVLEHNPGDSIEIVYLRAGREQKTQLVWR